MTIKIITPAENKKLKSEGNHYGVSIFVDDDRLAELTPHDWQKVVEYVSSAGDIMYICERTENFRPGIHGMTHSFISLDKSAVEGFNSVWDTVCKILIPNDKMNKKIFYDEFDKLLDGLTWNNLDRVLQVVEYIKRTNWEYSNEIKITKKIALSS